MLYTLYYMDLRLELEEDLPVPRDRGGDVVDGGVCRSGEHAHADRVEVMDQQLRVLWQQLDGVPLRLLRVVEQLIL